LSPGLSRSKNIPAIVGQLAANLSWSGAFAVLIAMILLASLYLKRPVLAGGLLTFALAAEILPPNLRLAPYISEADMNFVSKVNEHLGAASQEGPFRVMALESMRRDLRYVLRAPNDSLAWNSLFFRRAGLPFYGIMNGIEYSLYMPVDGLGTRESDSLFRLLQGAGDLERSEVLQRTNSVYIATLDRKPRPGATVEAEYDTGSDLKLYLYRLNGALERTYFASGVRRVNSQSEALKGFSDPDFPIRDCVILEVANVADREATREPASGSLLEYRSQYVRCETISEVPGYLVLLDSYYPGWVSSVDGREMPTLRANYAFRAVEVPAGKHRVEFRYKPWTFYAGLGVTLLASGIGIFLICCCGLRRTG
jgi:hypothetical protein